MAISKTERMVIQGLAVRVAKQVAEDIRVPYGCRRHLLISMSHAFHASSSVKRVSDAFQTLLLDCAYAIDDIRDAELPRGGGS